MSPEAYNPEDPLTPTAEDQPSRLIAYDIYPGGGWGQTSRWPGVPITPLSEITPNQEPWPYPLERYRSPVPTGALPYSVESSPALTKTLLPPSPHTDTRSPPVHPSADPPLSPVCQDAPGGKVLLYPQPRSIKPLPRRTVGPTTVSLQPTRGPSPRLPSSPLPAKISCMLSEPRPGAENDEEGFLAYLRESLRKQNEEATEGYKRKIPATPKTPSTPSTPSTSTPLLEFDPARLVLPYPQVFPTVYAPTSYPTQL